MLHPDLELLLAKLRFHELWQEAERFRLIRLSRQAHAPVAVPPGLEHLLRLKAEKREAWADLQKVAAKIESHPRWRSHPQAAAELERSLTLGLRLQSESSADDRQLGRDVLQLNSERARLARIWCSLEGLLPELAGDRALTEPSPALGR